MMRLSISSTGLVALVGVKSVLAINLDISSPDSIKSAARTIADEMMSYYTGNRLGDVPGNLPDPYFWWEAGAMFGSMVDYWYYTGDTAYNDVVTQALLFQVGPNNDYMPPNQTKTLGNDDQAFWAMAAMSAAEANYPNPPDDQPQWLELAQAVFNEQAMRWNEQSCGGGLKWQIFTFNNGFNYRNTISNGCFFNLASRLAVYTQNQTYADWAQRVYDWVGAIGLRSPSYQFFDGTDDTDNCTEINHIQWTYNVGVFLLGAANMYNFTNGDAYWQKELEGIMTGMNVFFTGDGNNVMYEVACEPNGKCNVDQRSFKAYLSRWMAASIKVAGSVVRDTFMPKIQASAQAAAQQCSGGNDGVSCGLRWTNGASFDGSLGVGEQMAAMQIIQANLIDSAPDPVSENRGGTSKGNPNAGTPSASESTPQILKDKITTADRAGAGILTVLMVSAVVGGCAWMAVGQ